MQFTFDYALNTDTTFTAAGSVRQQNGTLTLAANVVLTADILEFVSGTIDGARTVRVEAGDVLNWRGGTLACAGTTEIQIGGVVGFTGGTFGGLTINNAGTINLNNAMGISSASTIHNLPGALFDVRFNGNSFAQFAPFPVTFTNDAGATLRMSAGVGTSSFNGTLNNSGTVDVQTGTLSLDSGGANTGSFTAPKLHFNSTYALNAGTTVTAGTVRQQNGTLTLAANVVLTADILEFASGTVNGAGTVRVETGDVLNWSGATLAGAGTTEIQNGGLVNFIGGTLEGRTLNNAGTFNFNGVMGISSASTIHNLSGALFDVRFNGDSFAQFSPFPPTFTNDTGATLRKSVGAGTSSFNATLDNLGTVDAGMGTLNLTIVVQHAAGSSTLTGGTWIVRASATLDTPGANININQASVILDGAGSTFVKFNTVNANAASGAFTIQNGRNLRRAPRTRTQAPRPSAPAARSSCPQATTTRKPPARPR